MFFAIKKTHCNNVLFNFFGIKWQMPCFLSKGEKMDTQKTLMVTDEIEKSEISTNISDSQNELQIEEETEIKEGNSDLMDLLQVMRFPVNKGPGVVTEHSPKAWGPVIAVQALVNGFFVLCFYHSMNQKILNYFVNFGHSISNGLKNMSDELMAFLVNTVIFNVEKIPFIGESVSKAANNYLSDYLTLLATSISTETNDLLYNLYPAINLPEGIGFLMGVITSFLSVGLTALVLKLFLSISKHPFKSYPEIFSLLSVRGVVSIPIVFVISIISIFFPVVGVSLLPISMLFGMSYMLAVLFRCTDKTSQNRFVYVLPFIIILMFIILVLTVTIEGVLTGASIYVRLDAFFQTLK